MVRWGHWDVNPLVAPGVEHDLPLFLEWKSGQKEKGQFYEIYVDVIFDLPPDVEAKIEKTISSVYPEIERILDEYFDEVLARSRP